MPEMQALADAIYFAYRNSFRRGKDKWTLAGHEFPDED